MPERAKFDEERPASKQKRKNMISAGVDADLWDEFENWRVEKELTPSEALRRLLREALDDSPDSSRMFLLGVSTAAGAMYLVAVGVLQNSQLGSGVGGFMIAVAIAWAVAPQARKFFSALR